VNAGYMAGRQGTRDCCRVLFLPPLPVLPVWAATHLWLQHFFLHWWTFHCWRLGQHMLGCPVSREGELLAIITK